MRTEKPTTHDLANKLIRLNNLSQAKAAKRAGLAQQNTSRWLAGQPKALSEANQLLLLDALGVRYTTLRSDGVHQWCVRNIEDAAQVLNEALNEEDRTNVEIWHLHNSRHIGCVVLKVARSNETIWVLVYRPLMAERPEPINADSLKCGKDMGDVIVDNATWESWLPPAVLESATFGDQITKLISQFPFRLPPHEHFDEMEVTGGENTGELSQDELMESLAPTTEEIKDWSEVLLQAKLRRKTFHEIVSTTRKALGISVLGSKL